MVEPAVFPLPVCAWPMILSKHINITIQLSKSKGCSNPGIELLNAIMSLFNE